MDIVKNTEVAGMFYPSNAEELKNSIKNLISKIKNKEKNTPKALIVPHAGYKYSGEIAAEAYATLQTTNKIKKVILLGPSHKVPIDYIACHNATKFQTPLGEININQDDLSIAISQNIAKLDPNAFFSEHSLEVQLPFLQVMLQNFSITPFLIGSVEPDIVTKLLELLWGNDETLIIISADLSHYHDYKEAQRIDKNTTDAITKLEAEKIHVDSSCGQILLQALIQIVKIKGMKIKALNLKNSGDSTGDKDNVIGYGSYYVY